MQTILHKKFIRNLSTIFHKDYPKYIIIGTSGGQDSLCLIKLLTEYQHIYKWDLEVVYIDHEWRIDSQDNTKHLLNFIQESKMPITIYQTKRLKQSELEARKLRYRIFIQHAKKQEGTAIMTAHTQTDRIETFLQQLIRGTSIDGATSLTWSRQMNIYTQIARPLLNFNRSEVTWFCRKYYLPIWSDSTNYNNNIQRNRIRNELLPYMRQYFLNSVDIHIESFLEISNQENEYLKQNAIKLYMMSRHKTDIAINCVVLKDQHAAIQARTLQLFFYHHFNKSANTNMLSRIILSIQHNNKHNFSWEGLNIRISHSWLSIH